GRADDADAGLVSEQRGERILEKPYFADHENAQQASGLRPRRRRLRDRQGIIARFGAGRLTSSVCGCHFRAPDGEKLGSRSHRATPIDAGWLISTVASAKNVTSRW